MGRPGDSRTIPAKGVRILPFNIRIIILEPKKVEFDSKKAIVDIILHFQQLIFHPVTHKSLHS